MRQLYAHDAVLAMRPDADLPAPGGAVTLALCGSWDHEPPCPLAPHNVQAHRSDDHVRVRTVFAVEPDSESLVRRRIDEALAAGQSQGPDSVVTSWELRSSQRSELTAEEAAKGQRLARS